MKGNRVVTNASWIIGCKIAQSLLNMVVGMISARYLGPSRYGIISYAASIVAFATPFMKLGLNQTLVHEMTIQPEKEGKIVGSSIVLNVGASLLCILAIIGYLTISSRGERETQIVCTIYSLSLIFMATEMVQFWFQAKLKSKFPSIAVVVASAVVSAYKIYILATAKTVYWFAATNIIQYAVISLILIIAYMRSSEQRLGCSLKVCGQLLSRSKYYIFSSLMIVLYQQTDHIMLKTMIGDAENGYYAAAVTCAGVIGFVYAAIIDSLRPVILQQKGKSQKQYESYLCLSYSMIFYLSMAQSVFMTILAKPIVLILYGAEYAAAVNVLRVCVWYVTYAYFGSIRNIWIQGEGKHKCVWIIDFVGGLTNVLLNALLIPNFGAIGAASASVASQFFVNFLFGFIYKPIRENNKLILRSLNPKNLWNMAQMLLKKKPE